MIQQDGGEIGRLKAAVEQLKLEKLRDATEIARLRARLEQLEARMVGQNPSPILTLPLETLNSSRFDRRGSIKEEVLKMRELVPYSLAEGLLLERTVKVDISDKIPASRDGDAYLVKDQPMEVGNEQGKFTGWWKDGFANGRGTWRNNQGTGRIDAIWKRGQQHGEGREMWTENPAPVHHELLQGSYTEGKWSEGTKAYMVNRGGQVTQVFQNGRWTKHF